MNINIYMLLIFLSMLAVIFYVLEHRIISPALKKKRYWEVAIKITISLVVLGTLYFLFKFVMDCGKVAILIAVLVTIFFLSIILIWKDVQKKMKELKGGEK